MFEDIFAAFSFGVKLISSLKVLFTVKHTLPHCLTVFLMKLCELIKCSSECLNKILKALCRSMLCLKLLTCVYSVINGSIEKNLFPVFILLLCFFSEYCELHLFQFKEDCIVLLTCTDTREAVCSESIDSKYKKLGEEGNLSEKLCCFAWH